MRIGVFAGSFCPVTKGHVDAIEKAAKLVDKLYVVMGVNTNKSYAISKQARFEMLSRSINHIQNVQAVAFDGILTEYCKQVNASVTIKSVRNAMDTQSVIDLSDINEAYWDGETVFVVGSKDYRHISSSLVRELALLKQNYDNYVPSCCVEELHKYLAVE